MYFPKTFYSVELFLACGPWRVKASTCEEHAFVAKWGPKVNEIDLENISNLVLAWGYPFLFSLPLSVSTSSRYYVLCVYPDMDYNTQNYIISSPTPVNTSKNDITEREKRNNSGSQI